MTIREKILTLLTATILSSGCASKSIPELSFPTEPSLPKISAEALSCLSDDTYQSLVERDLALKEFIEILRVRYDN